MKMTKLSETIRCIKNPDVPTSLMCTSDQKRFEFLVTIHTKTTNVLNNDTIRKITVDVIISKINSAKKTKYTVIMYLHVDYSIAIVRDIIFEEHDLTELNQVTVVGVEKALLTCSEIVGITKKINVCVNFNFFTQKKKITCAHNDFLDRMTFFKKIDNKRLYENHYSYEGDYKN